MSGLFITFEGGEGSGKTTQTKALCKRLEQAGHSVVLTREPGGSTGAEEIRKLLVEGAPDKWSAQAETLLFYAAREDHLRHTIRPSLNDGKIVICDRFSDSTFAYQGAAHSEIDKLLEALEVTIVNQTKPDLTFLLDIDPETGLARAGSRGGDSADEDRFERKSLEYHQRLRSAFLQIADRNKKRVSVLDATLDPLEVEGKIWAIVERYLARNPD